MIRMTSTIAANLLPFLSTTQPMKKQPKSSPNPKTTMANIDSSYYSLEDLSGIEAAKMQTKTPE